MSFLLLIIHSLTFKSKDVSKQEIYMVFHIRIWNLKESRIPPFIFLSFL